MSSLVTGPSPRAPPPNSWYMTRLQSAKAPLFAELDNYRVLIGQGGFGKLYRTVDKTSGNSFAVKEIDLGGRAGVDLEEARTSLHREIKILESLTHVSLHHVLNASAPLPILT